MSHPEPVPAVASVGPRTGSDPSNAAQETAVLRAELRGLEGVLKERAIALDKALELAYASYKSELAAQWDTHRREHGLIQDAVAKAEAAVDKRLEGMNELREQITSERSIYLTRAVYETNHNELRSRVLQGGDKLIVLDAALASLREDVATLRSGQEWMVRLVVGTVVTAIIGVLITALRFVPSG